MKLYVKFDDSVVFDVLAQKMVDPKTVRQGRGAKIIPFAERISIRKLKPREKLSHRIGDRWISSRRVSFAYLMAHYMVKNNKTVLAGFFDRGDGKYVFMEIKAGNMTIEARYMVSVDSSPGNFMAMAGRQYDGVFGDVSLSMEPDYIDISYEKLLKEVTIGVTPLQAAAVLIVVAVIMGAVLNHAGLFTKKKVEPRTRAGAAKEIPPLTRQEIRALSILITGEALIKYKLYVETLPEDIALRSAVFHILPVAGLPREKGREQELKGTLSFQFESFYPFRGSKKIGDLFVFGKEIVFTKRRADMPAAMKAQARAQQNTKAFETLVNLCDVAARDDREWKFTVAQKDYRNVVRILNDIYLSPVVIDSITVNEGSTTGELTCHRF
ncbi:MAG: hypothetical protein A4E60_00010 [Syntrophorhabdus sp. PtaB.Bin047]|nr:MAG: hypothetical protein A4E60_00010 [Syntrophorhabdus sp. PtaB.Bin047]